MLNDGVIRLLQEALEDPDFKREYEQRMNSLADMPGHTNLAKLVLWRARELATETMLLDRAVKNGRRIY